MNPDRKGLTLTKEEAATRQTNAAIEAFARGDFDIAITLAGAAEDLIDREGSCLFSYMQKSPTVSHVDSKEWVRTLNLERNWLKHGGPNHAPALEIDREAAAFMIARAASKLEKWSPQMEEFRAWLRKNVDDL